MVHSDGVQDPFRLQDGTQRSGHQPRVGGHARFPQQHLQVPVPEHGCGHVEPLVVGHVRGPGSMVRFAEVHPKDDAEVVEQIKGVFAALEESRTVAAA